MEKGISPIEFAAWEKASEIVYANRTLKKSIAMVDELLREERSLTKTEETDYFWQSVRVKIKEFYCR